MTPPTPVHAAGFVATATMASGTVEREPLSDRAKPCVLRQSWKSLENSPITRTDSSRVPFEDTRVKAPTSLSRMIICPPHCDQELAGQARRTPTLAAGP